MSKLTGKQRKWLAFGISLPSKKDLGRKWFQKRLAGEEKRTFRLVAMTDVSMIHLETE